MTSFQSSYYYTRPSPVLLQHQQPPSSHEMLLHQQEMRESSSSKLLGQQLEVPRSGASAAAAAPPTELALFPSINGGIFPQPQSQQQQLLLVPKPICPNRRRRRLVRFQLPTESSSSSKTMQQQHHQRVGCLFSDEQKSELWVQKSDIRATVKNMQSKFCGIQQDSVEAADLATYGEALTAAYVACALPQQDVYKTSSSGSQQEESFAASVTAKHAGLFSLCISENVGSESSNYSKNRGLETCASPLLAVERSNKRRGDIRTIVGLYQLLRQAANMNEHQQQHVLDEPAFSLLLQSVAEQLSTPSRKFAQVLGFSDSMAALVEYLSLITVTDNDSSAAASCRKRSLDRPSIKDDEEEDKVFPHRQKMQKSSSPAA